MPEGSALPTQAPERAHGKRAARVTLPCRPISDPGAPSPSSYMPPRVLLCIVAVHTQLECRSSFIPEFFMRRLLMLIAVSLIACRLCLASCSLNETF